MNTVGPYHNRQETYEYFRYVVKTHYHVGTWYRTNGL